MKYDTWEYEFLILKRRLKYKKFIFTVISDIKRAFKTVKTNNRYKFNWFHSYTWIKKKSKSNIKILQLKYLKHAQLSLGVLSANNSFHHVGKVRNNLLSLNHSHLSLRILCPYTTALFTTYYIVYIPTSKEKNSHIQHNSNIIEPFI